MTIVSRVYYGKSIESEGGQEWRRREVRRDPTKRGVIEEFQVRCESRLFLSLNDSTSSINYEEYLGYFHSTFDLTSPFSFYDLHS